jgi:hypothetical protein
MRDDDLDQQVQELQAKKRQVKFLLREGRLLQNAKEREARKQEKIRKLRAEVVELSREAANTLPDFEDRLYRL